MPRFTDEDLIGNFLDTIAILSRAHADLNGSLTASGEAARGRIELILESLINQMDPISAEAQPEEAPGETE